VVVGDFNRDGKPDLAVSMLGSATVSVALGNGDGTFGPATGFAAGSSVWNLAVGDFNLDGIPDLAVTNPDSATVSVLLGTGTGAFGAPMSFATDRDPEGGLAVGDFNGDGQLDLVTGNNFSNDVSVLLNTTYPSLSCSRVTPAVGTAYLQCRTIDPAGIRRIWVVDLRTHAIEQSVAFPCAPNRKLTTASLRIPDDGNPHRVVITDCATGVNHVFVAAPDGTVTPK
jgi:hypothetical protein